jgi:hypothetical protein
MGTQCQGRASGRHCIYLQREVTTSAVRIRTRWPKEQRQQLNGHRRSQIAGEDEALSTASAPEPVDLHAERSVTA